MSAESIPFGGARDAAIERAKADVVDAMRRLRHLAGWEPAWHFAYELADDIARDHAVRP